MYHHPIRDPFVLDKIKAKSKILKRIIFIGDEYTIPHKPIGGNRRIGKKHRALIEDYHRLSEDFNTLKETTNLSLILLTEILDLVINVIPIKKY